MATSLRGPLPCALALAAGIAAAPHLAAAIAEPVRWAAAFLLVGVAALRAPRLALVAVFAVGAARGAPSPEEPPPGADDRIADRIEGVVEGPVVRTPRGFGARLDTGVWAWTSAPIAPGEQIAVTGFLRTPRGSLGPAQPDRAAALRARGARVEISGDVERIADDPGPIARAWRWAAETQAAWSSAIDGAGGDAAARAALRGIAVGDRAEVPPALDERWRIAGIYHVLSVSGLHLAAVAGLIFMLLRRLFAASPWGGRARPARWAALPALALAIAYTLITGAQLATLRALLVAAFVLGAAALDRPLRLSDALGAAALVLLALRPADLFDPAFQLSFTAALTLALRPRGAGARRGIIGRIAGWIRRGIAASVWIAIATAPITAYHFHAVHPGGVVGNLVLTPLLELIALPLALGGLAIGWALPVRLATELVALVDRAAALLGPALPVGHVAVAGAILLAVLVALSLWLAARAARGGREIIAWLALCAAWALARTPPPPGALRVTFLDVGQGDAALVELPDGAVWLVDAGGFANARDPAAASAPGRTIRRALAAAGHTRIDLAIISHPHPDHYLGLSAIGLPIDELWTARDPEASPAPAPFARVLDELRAGGTIIAHPPLGAARAQAGVELVVWAPRYQAADGGAIVEAADPVRSVNDNSLVVELRYRGRALLFTGDLEAEGEALLVEAGIGRADVVKVAHHGSPTSSTPAFVAATHPTVAVISCGRANTYGFPAAAVLERWRAAGADIARTDDDGAITATIDAAGALAIDRFVGR